MCGVNVSTSWNCIWPLHPQQLTTEGRDGMSSAPAILQPLNPFTEHVCRRQPAHMRRSLYIYTFPPYFQTIYVRNPDATDNKKHTSSAWCVLQPAGYNVIHDGRGSAKHEATPHACGSLSALCYCCFVSFSCRIIRSVGLRVSDALWYVHAATGICVSYNIACCMFFNSFLHRVPRHIPEGNLGIVS